MATTYEPADKAEEIALSLIEEHHKHLKQARIVWLRTTTGQSKARVCNALLQHAFGKDASGVFPAFVVVVTDVDWARHRKSREALIDTLLCSMVKHNNADTGKDRWATAKPDVSLFLAVVKRHGLSTTEEQQVGKLIKDLPEQLALVLDGEDQDDDEDDQDRDPGDDYTVRIYANAPQETLGNDDPPKGDDWETVTRPDVSPDDVSRIRSSVEASVK